MSRTAQFAMWIGRSVLELRRAQNEYNVKRIAFSIRIRFVDSLGSKRRHGRTGIGGKAAEGKPIMKKELESGLLN